MQKNNQTRKHSLVPISNPSARSICDPRDLTRHHASAAAKPEPHDHTSGRSTNSLLVHNMLLQIMQLYKAYQRPSRPPPRRKTGGASCPLSGGKKPRGGLPITESGRWIWWERKKIGARPSSYPPPDPSAIPTSTATTPPQRTRASTARNAGEGSLLKESPLRASIHSDKRSQSGQSTPSSANSACSKADHTLDCVYPQQWRTHIL